MTENAPTQDTDWKFEAGDVIREMHEQFASGGISLGKSEYKIERQLRDEADGKRFYHVATTERGLHLYAASAIEHSYEVIPTAESRVFTDE